MFEGLDFVNKMLKFLIEMQTAEIAALADGQ